MIKRLSLLFLLLPSLLFGEQSLDELMEALETVARIDRQLYERFPATFTHLFSTGYFVTHSACMTESGSIGVGVAHAPPLFELECSDSTLPQPRT